MSNPPTVSLIHKLFVSGSAVLSRIKALDPTKNPGKTVLVQARNSGQGEKYLEETLGMNSKKNLWGEHRMIRRLTRMPHFELFCIQNAYGSGLRSFWSDSLPAIYMDPGSSYNWLPKMFDQQYMWTV